jgi:hypothetical protein
MNHTLRNHFLKLLRHEEGGVLILVAVAMFLLVIVVGVAVDYSRAQAVQARMQSALDAAGLDIVAEMTLYDPSTDGTPDHYLQVLATRFFNANFPDGYLESSPVILTTELIHHIDVVEIIDVGVNLTATSTDPTDFMHILGVSSVPVSAFTQVVVLSAYRSEFAFVIDNSAAMNLPIEGVPRIQTVQNALTNLINYDFPPTGIRAFYGAIVPFAGAENIGTGYPGWMTGTTPPGWSGCVLARDAGQVGPLVPNLTYDISEDEPLSHPTLSQFNAYNNIYAGGSINHNTGCPAQITTDQNTAGPLVSAVSAMTAVPNTDTIMDLGLAWGWRLLSPHWQNRWGGFMDANGLPLNYNLPGRKKIMILVTSGANYMDDGNPNDYNAYGHQGGDLHSPHQAEMDTRTLTVCNAFKNIDPANNIIFTVGFGPPDTVNTPLLQACATSPDFSYTVSTNRGLYVAMTDMGREVQLMFLSQ